MTTRYFQPTLLAASLAITLSACGGSDSSGSDIPDIEPPDTNVAATFSGDLSLSISANQAEHNGSISISDPDAGEATINAQNDVSTNFGIFSINSAGAYSYILNIDEPAVIALGEGQDSSESIPIRSADGTSTNITITIEGINEPATFSSGTNVDSASISNQQDAAVTGNIVVTDPDNGQSFIDPQTNIDSSYGSFSITESGVWTYTLDRNNANVVALSSPEQTLTDTIQIFSSDGSEASISILISGVQSVSSSVLIKGSIGSNDSVPEVSCDTVVNSTSQLEDAVSFSMTPGETLCLANGSYTGLDLSFGGAGTSDAPIKIAAETPGQVIIDGEVFIGMTGDYAILQGFVFRDGNIGSSLLQTRANGNTACNNCRITENTFINMDSEGDDSSKWFQIYGSNNRFDHNWVSGKSSRGALFVIERGSTVGTEDRTQIDHNYFGDRPPKNGLGYAEGSDNEYEGIRVGSSNTHTSDSFAVIEHNYFEGIDGEAEVISIKAGEVTVRHNTIRNSRGSIVNRHGEGATIANNFIIGDGNPFSGGIRIVDADHQVVNNYIEGARYLSTNFNGGLLVSNSDGSTSNGYQDVENVLVANNTVIDSVNSVNLYAGSRSTRPNSVYFVNNIVDDAIGSVIRNADTLPNDSVFAGNIVHGESLSDNASLSSLSGFTFTDPALEKGDDNLARPSNNSPDLSADMTAGLGAFSLPLLDMDGQTRSSASVAGADESLEEELSATALRGVLSPELVGPLSYEVTPSEPSIKVLTINNASFDSGDLSAWTAVNAAVTTASDEVFSRGASAVVTGGNASLSQTIALSPERFYTLSAFIAGDGALSASLGDQTFTIDRSSSAYGFEMLSFASGDASEVTITAALSENVVSNVALVNPNFDDAQTGWVVNEGSGIGQVQDSSNSSSSTDGSIKFTYNDTDSGDPYNPYIAQTITVEPNTDYTIGMYILLKESDEQDATVLFGAHSGTAIEGGIFASSTVLASKNSVYADLSEADEAEDSFRPDSVSFNSGNNTTVTIFAQYQSNLGDDIRIDEFTVTSAGAAADDAKAYFDDFRLISHPNL
ncbi:VCBS domain-containing protein [Glaciecola sp. MH2013]|uniref:chondroitinase-B domain-containing protein n=1 Tax=Glaciecola sp. MH2013 TaxID=2785524 RepID=UPI00189E8557|nr:chondroitinase-B domain-containing protein [Glaciecola sp. MH2013]MBF7074163.1 VCBS domain-containing protein [Glaciecola sp. MH2013]